MPKFEQVTLPFPLGNTVDTVVLTPNRASNGVFFWRLPTFMQHSHPATRPTVSMSNTMPSKSTKYQRTRIKFLIPVPKLDTGGNMIESSVDYTVSANIEIDVPDVASTDARNAVLDLLATLFGSDNGVDYMQALVVNGEGIYA